MDININAHAHTQSYLIWTIDIFPILFSLRPMPIIRPMPLIDKSTFMSSNHLPTTKYFHPLKFCSFVSQCFGMCVCVCFIFLVLFSWFRSSYSRCNCNTAIYLIKMASKIWNNLYSTANGKSLHVFFFILSNNKTATKILHSIQFGCRKLNSNNSNFFFSHFLSFMCLFCVTEIYFGQFRLQMLALTVWLLLLSTYHV